MLFLFHQETNKYWEIINKKRIPKINELIKLKDMDNQYLLYKVKITDKIIESNWNDILLDYYKNSQEAKCGWINKQGDFFGCKEYDHARCIQIISKMYEKDAEQIGWIKIYYDTKHQLYWYINPKCHLTKAQSEKLFDKGFERVE